jgi:hypothetical protein
MGSLPPRRELVDGGLPPLPQYGAAMAAPSPMNLDDMRPAPQRQRRRVKGPDGAPVRPALHEPPLQRSVAASPKVVKRASPPPEPRWKTDPSLKAILNAPETEGEGELAPLPPPPSGASASLDAGGTGEAPDTPASTLLVEGGAPDPMPASAADERGGRSVSFTECAAELHLAVHDDGSVALSGTFADMSL